MKVASLNLNNANSTSSKKTPSFRASLVCTSKAFENILTNLSNAYALYSKIHTAEETEKMFGKKPFNAVKKYREFRRTFEEQTREALPGYRFILIPSTDPNLTHTLGLKLQTPKKKILNFYNGLIDPQNIMMTINKGKTLNTMTYELLLTGARLLRKKGKHFDESNPCMSLLKKLTSSN